jgi:ABC-2 type transport system ATP-binding protein
MKKAIEIIGLTKKYKNNRGIFDLDMDVHEGDIFGFLGPNGAGKTTAMKIMVGLMKPDHGTVKIFGRDIQEDYEEAMASVGCLIETAEMYPYLTAFENLKLVARFYEGIDEKRIDECLEVTGILPFKNEKSKNFSLGMKQRLGLALAILSKPKLIILDEPLNGMDVEGMVEMRKLIQKLAAEDKITFFISSHLIHDVELTCNVVGVINKGKILSVNYVETILQNHDTLESYFMSEVDTDEQS